MGDFSARSDEKLGVLICGHGSRNRLAVEEFAQMVEALRPRLAPLPVEHGYLEFARPVLRDGLDALRAKGVDRILAIPAMLFAAGHAKNDIPSVLNTYTAETGLPIDYGRELGVDRLMVAAAGARIQEALDQAERCPPFRDPVGGGGTWVLRPRRQFQCGQGDPDVGGGLRLWLG